MDRRLCILHLAVLVAEVKSGEITEAVRVQEGEDVVVAEEEDARVEDRKIPQTSPLEII